jgi:hypothetical protein
MESGSNVSKLEGSHPWQKNKNGMGMRQMKKVDSREKRERTSPKKGREAEVVTIGFAACWSDDWSVTRGELEGPGVVDGIGTSSTIPLEVSLICKGNGKAIQLVTRHQGTRAVKRVTLETSWLGEEVCGPVRALLTHRRLMRDLVWTED